MRERITYWQLFEKLLLIFTKKFYYLGTTFRDPSQYLPICGKTIEEQIVSLHDNVFKPAKFDVVSFTRLPYLCEGDLNTDFFVLNDIVFVLKPRLGVDGGDEASVLSPDAQCKTRLI